MAFFTFQTYRNTSKLTEIKRKQIILGLSECRRQKLEWQKWLAAVHVSDYLGTKNENVDIDDAIINCTCRAGWELRLS